MKYIYSNHPLNLDYTYKKNKSSAAAETGDRARAKWAEKWGRGAVPLCVGEGSWVTI